MSRDEEITRTARIKQWATELGFHRVGVARAQPIERVEFLREWLKRGYAGRMAYLHRNVASRVDPRAYLPAARSVIVVALNYHQSEPKVEGGPGPRGRIAEYAWGADYHKVVKRRLERLIARMRDRIDEPFEARACVDTSPLIERKLAASAGIGWIGKNTMVLHHELGSFFFLGEVVTTLDLAPDERALDRCGTCTRCLEACPTRAFPAPYVMDASRCISYLTIELRDDVPADLRETMGDWVYGCDVCQQVCPYNREAPTSDVAEFAVRDPSPRPLLADLLAWDDAVYRERLAGTALRRAKPAMWRRNARIATANLERRNREEIHRQAEPAKPPDRA